MNVARSVTLVLSLGALVGGSLVVYRLSQIPSSTANKAAGIISTRELAESAMDRPVEEPVPNLVLFCGNQEKDSLTSDELAALTEKADKTFWNYETKVMRITGASARRGADQQALLRELKDSIEWYAAQLKAINLPDPGTMDSQSYRQWCDMFKNKHRKIPEKCRQYYKKTLVDNSGTIRSK